MTRRRRLAGVDPLADLEKKIEILEHEMAVQRAALDRLKQMGSSDQTAASFERPISRTA